MLTEGIYLHEISPEMIACGGIDFGRIVEEMLREVFGADLHLAHFSGGRPYLPARPRVSVSVSHCECAVALAVAQNPCRLGVDVEHRVERVRQTLPRICSEQELRLIEENRLNPLSAWCAKEALYKAWSDRISTFTAPEVELVSVGHRGLTARIVPPDRKPRCVKVEGYVRESCLVSYTVDPWRSIPLLEI